MAFHGVKEDSVQYAALSKGFNGLTDRDILKLIVQNEKASDVLWDLLERSLSNINNLPIKDILKIKGIGIKRAFAIKAFQEIGKRMASFIPTKNPQIRSSIDAYNQVDFLKDYIHEEFWVLLLNRSNRVLLKKQISIGGIAGTVVDTKIIFKAALEVSASRMVLVHNHPSGNKNPSSADIELTKKINEAGQVMSIPVIDHLIVAGDSYISFADEGMM